MTEKKRKKGGKKDTTKTQIQSNMRLKTKTLNQINQIMNTMKTKYGV